MEDRAAMLRRRIDAYHRVLQDGVGLEMVRLILDELARDQAELEKIEREESSKP